MSVTIYLFVVHKYREFAIKRNRYVRLWYTPRLEVCESDPRAWSTNCAIYTILCIVLKCNLWTAFEMTGVSYLYGKWTFCVLLEAL